MEKVSDQKLNHFESIKASLKQRIERAQMSALPIEEFEATDKKINEIERLYFEEKISYDRFQELIIPLDWARNRSGIVRMSTLPEFHEALKICELKDELINEILAHENAHAGAAEELGVKNLYKIMFVKLDDDRLGFFPAVEYEYPDNITLEEKFEIKKKLTSAPERLSPSDKLKLSMGEK